MRRFGSIALVLLAASGAFPAKGKKSSSASKAPVAAPVVNPMDTLQTLFAKAQPLPKAKQAIVLNGLDSLKSDCGQGCTQTFATVKVQNRTPRYIAVQLHVEKTAKDRVGNSTWLLVFDPKGARVDARQLDGRESSTDGRNNGVRSVFSTPDSFETRTWSSFETVTRADPTLGEGTPETWRISEDGHVVEGAVGK
jgi:hypothetical protein